MLQILWFQHVSELCQAEYRLGSSVARALARKTNVPGSNAGLDTFHFVRENLLNFDLHLQQI